MLRGILTGAFWGSVVGLALIIGAALAVEGRKAHRAPQDLAVAPATLTSGDLPALAATPDSASLPEAAPDPTRPRPGPLPDLTRLSEGLAAPNLTAAPPWPGTMPEPAALPRPAASETRAPPEVAPPPPSRAPQALRRPNAGSVRADLPKAPERVARADVPLLDAGPPSEAPEAAWQTAPGVPESAADRDGSGPAPPAAHPAAEPATRQPAGGPEAGPGRTPALAVIETGAPAPADLPIYATLLTPEDASPARLAAIAERARRDGGVAVAVARDPVLAERIETWRVAAGLARIAPADLPGLWSRGGR